MRAIAISGMLFLGATSVAAQAPGSPAAPPAWTFSASADTYILPGAPNYLQPTFTADRRRQHLEARFNDEGLDTGSVWVGINFSGGSRWAWTLTPMVGGVFGNVNGLAPGYRGSIAWRGLEFDSEGELMIDVRGSADSFFYNWSELTLAPVDWLRFGLVTQRTRAYQAARDVQRGVLVGTSIGKLDLSAYVLNPDDSKRLLVLAFGVSF